jgi:hypothetical protein
MKKKRRRLLGRRFSRKQNKIILERKTERKEFEILKIIFFRK